MEREDFIVNVYKLDRRYKDGERIHQVLQLPNEYESWAKTFVQALIHNQYTTDKYRIELKPKYAMVKNLLTGKLVEIRNEDRGTCCDPSTETFWSM